MKRAVRPPSRLLDDRNRLPLAVCLDVLRQRLQLGGRWARENQGGGMDRENVAPGGLAGGRFSLYWHGSVPCSWFGDQRNGKRSPGGSQWPGLLHSALARLAACGCVVGLNAHHAFERRDGH